MKSMRKGSIDLLRIILFFMVVAIHTVTGYLTANHTIGTVNWQFANLLDGGSRAAVCCFVIISGYFLCDSEKNGSCHVKKLLLPLALYLLPYFGLTVIEDGFSASVLVGFFDKLLRAEWQFYHLWYVYVLIILYFFVPYINRLISSLGVKEFRRILILLIIVFSIVPSFCYLFDYRFVNYTDFANKLGLFITLYFTGAYIRTHLKLRTKSVKLLGIFALCEIFVVFLTAFYNSRYSPLIPLYGMRGIELTYPLKGFTGAFYAYDSIFVVIAAVFLFLFFLSLDFKNSFAEKIASHSYGAYLIHTFWITVLSKIMALSPFIRYESPYYGVYAVAFIAIAGTFSLLSAFLLDFIFSLLRRGFGRKPI